MKAGHRPTASCHILCGNISRPVTYTGRLYIGDRASEHRQHLQRRVLLVLLRLEQAIGTREKHLALLHQLLARAYIVMAYVLMAYVLMAEPI